MRIESYEKLKADIAAHEAKCKGDNAKKAAAAAEVKTSKGRYDEVLNRAAQGVYTDEMAIEVSKAQGEVLIAEKKQQQLLAQLGVETSLQGFSRATSRVRSEIQQLISDGTILAELQPALDELAAIQAEYLDKLRDVLQGRADLNRKLRDIQLETQSLEQQITGNSFEFGIMGAAQLDLGALRKWVWMFNDLGEVTTKLENEAYEAANGPGYKGKGVILRDNIMLID